MEHLAPPPSPLPEDRYLAGVPESPSLATVLSPPPPLPPPTPLPPPGVADAQPLSGTPEDAPRVTVSYELSHEVAVGGGGAPLAVLRGCGGTLRAGTATLVLAAPGAGASTLLRLLTARAAPQAGSRVLYNGLSAAELEAAGVSAARLCALASSADAHEPTLSVAETLRFACALADAEGDGAAAAAELVAQLGLEPAAATPVGSAALRGISGGEKRRLTVGEALATRPRVLALDGITTGVDSNTALRLVRRLACEARASGGALLAVLMQPGPEVVALFDEVILLSEGLELFHGPVAELAPFLAAAGLACPRYHEIGEWLSEVVASPKEAMRVALASDAAAAAEDEVAARAAWASGSGGSANGDAALPAVAALPAAAAAPHGPPPLPEVGASTVAALGQRWRESARYAADAAAAAPLFEAARRRDLPSARRDVLAEWAQRADRLAAWVRRALSLGSVANDSGHVEEASAVRASVGVAGEGAGVGAGVDGLSRSAVGPGGVLLQSELARRRYGLRPAAAPLRQLALLVQRQSRLLRRNRPLLAARIVSPVLMASVLGSVLLARYPDPLQILFGVSYFSAVFVSLTNNSETPTILNSRSVVYKHVGARLYSPGLWIAAVVVNSVPLTVAAVLAFSSIVYWTAGYAPNVLRWGFFMLVVFSADLFFAAYLRLLALAVPTQDVANAIGAGVMGVWFLTGGFYVLRSLMPTWLAWLSWVSPMWFAISALSINEFRDPRWGSAGATYLSAFDIPDSKALQWLAVAFLLGGALLFSLAVPIFFAERRRYDVVRGTQRPAKPATAAPAPRAQRRLQRAHLQQQLHLMPFAPMALVFEGISYSVEAVADKGAPAHWQAAASSAAPPAAAARPAERLSLLRSVSGFALPGRLTACRLHNSPPQSTALTPRQPGLTLSPHSA